MGFAVPVGFAACNAPNRPYNRLMFATYQQLLDPLGNPVLSTILAAVPVVVLFWLLVPRRWLASKAGAAGAITAIAIAWLVFGMPIGKATMAFIYGAAFGLMPIGWTIFNAMLIYNVTVATGQFTIIRRSVAGLSGDARVQAILIGFAFGAFLEGAAGAGSPVAICGAMLVGLGFEPFLAAVLCLIANTSPVAYGGLGTPLIVLGGVTDIETDRLSIMAGHQLPLLSCIVPLYMVKVMCTWKQVREVWPVLLVAGGSFAIFQFTFATCHAYFPSIVLWPMTDIGGGIFSLVLTAIFLRFWKPKNEWHFDKDLTKAKEVKAASEPPPLPTDGHAAEAAALLANDPSPPAADDVPLTISNVSLAWAPYVIMSVLLLLTGLVRQMERHGPVYFGPIRTAYFIPIPGLHNQVERDHRLHPYRIDQLAALTVSNYNPLAAAANVATAQALLPKVEKAEFEFAWLTSPGSAVFLAALISMVMLRMTRAQIRGVVNRTMFQMRVPIPTIACMLGLSYVTRYAGMDATLGFAFASTGVLYPFFAAILGWVGVFLTGTDAGSNALFGSLQKISATTLFNSGVFTTLSKGLPQAAALLKAQVLICTANSTGGVMGKMIDAQSICVATAATNQIGKEADIFKAVIWHSIALASIVGLLTLLQAYVYPFTLMVPGR